MRVREYKSADAEALHAIFVRAVREIGRRDYSDAQVGVWAARAPDPSEYTERAQDGRVLLVATDDQDIPIAYIDLEADGHIDHLFCRPDWVGKGIASALYEEIERVAVARQIKALYVEASEASRRLFLRRGFTELKRRDFCMEGVPIHNYAMAKSLVLNAPETGRSGVE
jgi:putative acetyltransferase